MRYVRARPATSAIGSALMAVATGVALVVPGTAAPQARHYALESTDGLRLHNVAAEPATLQGKRGVRITISQEATQRLKNMAPDAQSSLEQLAVIDGVDFANGVIEAELAGEPAPGAFEGARGFVGIAFRVQNDMRTYDAFYVRPTNGRAEDQERRNHSAQYISHPDWTWFRLRKETPSKYESYVDLMPGVWAKIKIDIQGEHGRLSVNGQEQPTLIVNDLKTGAHAKGGIALWLDGGTVAHFRNLTVEPSATQ